MTGLAPAFAAAVAAGIDLDTAVRTIVREEIAAALADQDRRRWERFEALGAHPPAVPQTGTQDHG